MQFFTFKYAIITSSVPAFMFSAHAHTQLQSARARQSCAEAFASLAAAFLAGTLGQLLTACRNR